MTRSRRLVTTLVVTSAGLILALLSVASIAAQGGGGGGGTGGGGKATQTVLAGHTATVTATPQPPATSTPSSTATPIPQPSQTSTPTASSTPSPPLTLTRTVAAAGPTSYFAARFDNLTCQDQDHASSPVTGVPGNNPFTFVGCELTLPAGLVNGPVVPTVMGATTPYGVPARNPDGSLVFRVQPYTNAQGVQPGSFYLIVLPAS